MTPEQRLEIKVLSWVDQVLRGRRIEGSIVDCKAVWPTDHQRSARQIAGLCNAAQGADVVWLIGIDEDAAQLTQYPAVEIADWWSQVSSRFDDVAPGLFSLSVPVAEGHQVIALQFSSSRAPYVIKLKPGGPSEREVPWRDGTRTRSAYRYELQRLLAPTAELPSCELTNCFANAKWQRDDSHQVAYVRFGVTGRILINPIEIPILLPSEGVAASLSLHDSLEEPAFETLSLEVVQMADSQIPGAIRSTSDGFLIEGPGYGKIHMRSVAGTADLGTRNFEAHALRLTMTLAFVGIQAQVTLDAVLNNRQKDNEGARWARTSPPSD